jgi:hypothetical protein
MKTKNYFVRFSYMTNSWEVLYTNGTLDGRYEKIFHTRYYSTKSRQEAEGWAKKLQASESSNDEHHKM